MANEAILLPENFSIQGRGGVLTGTLQSGVLKVGMETTLDNFSHNVSAIETFRKGWKAVSSGDSNTKNVGILLHKLSKETAERYTQNRQPIVFRETPSSLLIRTAVSLPVPVVESGGFARIFFVIASLTILLLVYYLIK